MNRCAVLYHPRTFHEQNYRYYYVPYSIVSIAASLGPYVPCMLFDNNVWGSGDPAGLPLPDPRDWGVVGVSVMIGQQIVDALRFTEYVKKRSPTCPVVWGGPCATMLPTLVLDEAPVDFIVLGAGEVTSVELWKAIQSGAEVDKIPGIGLRRNGQRIVTPPRRLASYDGLLPYRAVLERINVHDYIKPDEHIGSRTVNYHSSQGCPFRCGFCCEPVLWGGGWAGMPAQRIVEDIAPLVERYQVNGIKFHDSEFFIRAGRALEFAHLLIQRALTINWGASIHPKNLMALADEDLGLLRKSGLSRLLIGAESAVKEELDLIKKPMTRELIRCASLRCASAAISASFTFVTGYPGVPAQNIDETLSFAEGLVEASPRHEVKIHFYAPYPGTPLYPLAIAHGFNPPTSLTQWAGYDYYYVQTPWVPETYFGRVRDFNMRFYPYLTATDTS